MLYNISYTTESDVLILPRPKHRIPYHFLGMARFVLSALNRFKIKYSHVLNVPNNGIL